MSESILVYNLNCKAYLLQNIELINMLKEISHMVDVALCRTDTMRVFHEKNQFKNYSVVSQNICQKRSKKTRSEKTHRDMTENRGNTGDMAVLQKEKFQVIDKNNEKTGTFVHADKK